MSNQKKKTAGATAGRVRTSDLSKAKKPTAAKGSAKNATEKKTFINSNNRLAIILIAAVLALVLIIGVVIGIVAVVKNSKAKEAGATANYLSLEDIAKYVSVPESAYKGLLVDIDSIDKVSDTDVQMAIYKLLVKNKNKTPKENGKYLKNMTVTLGDVVLIQYMGYTLDEDGNAVVFSGGCNFGSSGDDSKLEIGSGGFINGFEIGMIGKNAKDYDTLTTITYEDACNGFADGEILAGDVISLTYTVMHPDGKTEVEKTAIIDLGSLATDKTYGEGFVEKLVGKKIDELAGKSIATELESGRLGYTDLKVNAIYRYGDNPLTVETYFPGNYSEESLRGKTAYFDVFVQYSQLYDTPEWNEAFITDTLKVDNATLEGYEGDTVTEKYENLLRAQLEDEYDAAVQALVEEKLWESIIKGVNVSKLPAGDVTEQYNAYYYSYVEGYENYGAMYGYSSIDEYVCLNLGLEKGTDWKALLRLQAEDTVVQKLAFYYAILKEGYVPSEAELESRIASLKEDVLNSYLESVDCQRENYDTEEEYLKAVEGYKKTVDSQYDYSYYKENVYYEYGMECLCSLAVIDG